MTRRFFIKILLALGLGNFFPKLAQAEQLQSNFKMLVFADSQCVDYGVWQKVADAANIFFPDAELVTVIGDLVDNGAANYQWQAWQKAAENLLRGKIFLPVCGNHECYNLDWKFCLPENYLRRFNFPPVEEKNFAGHFYSFDYGAASFFVLNNNFEELENFLPDLQKVQENFLRREVAKSERTWKIILMHKDIYDYANDKFNDIGKIFMPLFDELKIDLVLTGHLHTYRNRGKIFAEKKSAEGTCYILCGRAGDQKYLEPNSDVDEVTLPNASTEFEPETFLAVDIDENFLSLNCLTIDGEIFDQFTLKKN